MIETIDSPGAHARVLALASCLLVCGATGCASPHRSGNADGGSSQGGSDGGSSVDDTFLTTRVGGAPSNVQAVEFQDGCGTGGSCDGTWHPLAGHEGAYPFSVTGTHYSLAVACSNPYGGFVLVRATPSERPHPVVDCAVPGGTTSARVHGPVTGFDASSPDPSATVGVGTTTTTWSRPDSSDPSEYSLDVGSGTYDLVAVTGADGFSGPARMVLHRDLAVTGDTSVPLAFDADGFALDAAPHALSVVDPEHVSGATDEVSFLTASTAPRGFGIASGGEVGVLLGSWSDVRQTYPVVPASETRPGDLHCASGVTHEAGTASWVENESRSVRRFFSVPQDLQLELPPRFETAVAGASVDAEPAAPQAPVAVVQVAVGGRAPLVRGFEIDCGGGGPPPSWHAEISVAGLGTDTTITVPPRDLIQPAGSAFGMMGFSQSNILCSIGALSGDDPWAPPRDGETLARSTIEVSFVEAGGPP